MSGASTSYLLACQRFVDLNLVASAPTLILSQAGDLHAYAVFAALRHKGSNAVVWHTADFPTRSSETVLFEGGTSRLQLKGPELDLLDPHFAAVWNRRPTHQIDPERLHPADREFADLGCKIFRKALFQLVSPSAFWVNPHDAVRRNSKILQHALARKVGLETADTLFSNDPQEIRGFIRRHGGTIVYKPLKTLPWRDEETYWMPYTSLLTEAQLVGDEALRAAPGIYQAQVPKASELRVTMMGGCALAVRIFSQQTESGGLDWRKAYHELRMEVAEIPPSVRQCCIELMEELGIVFGCFDFIVTPRGDHVFLEVNQMGQFLFLEAYTDLPILDAFAEFLLAGRPDFDWKPRSNSLRWAQVKQEATAMLEAASQHHVTPRESVWHESPPTPPA